MRIAVKHIRLLNCSTFRVWRQLGSNILQKRNLGLSLRKMGTAAEEFEKLLDGFWKWRLQDGPEFASMVGEHHYDDRLESASEHAQQARFFQCRYLLTQLEAIDRYALASQQQRSYDLLYSQVRSVTKGFKWRYHGLYNCVNFLENIPVDFVSYLISSMKFESVTDYEKYLSRLKAIPRLAREQETLMREAVTMKITLHERSLIGAVRELEKSGKCPPEESIFYKPLEKIAEVEAISNDDQESMRNATLKAILDDVQPAMKGLAEYLETEYRPHCRSEVGVGCLPDGEAYYRACLAWHLTLSMSPKDVYQSGEREVARIREGMDKVRQEVGFQGTLNDFIQHMRSAPEFYHSTKEALLQEYEEIIHQHIKPLLSKVFERDPGIELKVKVMPFSGPGGMYFPPSPDGSRPGVFYANLEQPESRPRFSMVVLSLHEASPGHHFQISFSLQEDIPRFRKEIDLRKVYGVPFTLPMYTSYIEGWALYCEYLGLEMGAYRTPYDLFGRYSDEILRACRLVVDPGLHVFSWTREKAVAYMQENTCLPLDEIEQEVDRYITWPGQACAYKVGEITIRNLRRLAEDTLGDKFCVKAFHEVVLKVGAVPLDMLESVVQEWIEQVQQENK